MTGLSAWGVAGDPRRSMDLEEMELRAGSVEVLGLGTVALWTAENG